MGFRLLLKLLCLPVLLIRGAESFLDLSYLCEPNYTVNSALALPGGKAVIAGGFTSVSAVPRPGVAQLNADGSVDTNFNAALNSGTVVSRLLRRSNGEILAVAVGSLGSSIFQLRTNGAMSGNFARIDIDGGLFGMQLLPSEKLLISSQTRFVQAEKCRIVRYEADGRLDTNFSAPTLDLPVRSFLPQADGKVLIGGDFKTLGGTPRVGIARLNENGALDLTFNSGGDLLAGYPTNIYLLQIQNGGRILVGALGGMYRLFANGNPDDSLGVIRSDGYISEIIEQPTGFIVGGSFTSIGNQSRRSIARILSGGSVDTGFDLQMAPVTTGFDADGRVSDLVALENDILMGGRFQSIEGVARQNLARLNAEAATPVPLLGVERYLGVTMSGTVGSIYEVQYATNASSSAWFSLTNVVLTTSPMIFVDLETHGSSMRIYRAILRQ